MVVEVEGTPSLSLDEDAVGGGSSQGRIGRAAKLGSCKPVLLFLDTSERVPPPSTWSPPPLEALLERAKASLSSDLLQDKLSMEEHDLYTGKLNLLATYCRRKLANIKKLTDDHHVMRATIEDHRKIDDWFDSMVNDPEDPSELKTERVELLMHRINYDKVIWDGREGELQRKIVQATAALTDLKSEAHQADDSTEEELTQDTALLQQDILQLEVDLEDIEEKLREEQYSVKGCEAKNNILMKKLKKLEGLVESGKDLAAASGDELDALASVEREVRRRCCALTEALELAKANFDSTERARAQKETVMMLLSRDCEKSKLTLTDLEASKARRDKRLHKMMQQLAEMHALKASLAQTEAEQAVKLRGVERTLGRDHVSIRRLSKQKTVLTRTTLNIELRVTERRRKVEGVAANLAAVPDAGAVEGEKARLAKDTALAEGKHKAEQVALRKSAEHHEELSKEVKVLKWGKATAQTSLSEGAAVIRRKLRVIETSEKLNRMMVEEEKACLKVLGVVEARRAECAEEAPKRRRQVEQLSSEVNNERGRVKSLREECQMASVCIKRVRKQIVFQTRQEENMKAIACEVSERLKAARLKVEKESEEVQKTRLEVQRAKSELAKARLEIEAREQAILGVKQRVYKAQVQGEVAVGKIEAAAADLNHRAMREVELLQDEAVLKEQAAILRDMTDRGDAELQTRGEVVLKLQAVKRNEERDKRRIQRAVKETNLLLGRLDEVLSGMQRFMAGDVAAVEARFTGDRHRMLEGDGTEDVVQLQSKHDEMLEQVERQEGKLLEVTMLLARVTNMNRILEAKCVAAQEGARAFWKAKNASRRRDLAGAGQLRRLAAEVALMRAKAEALQQQTTRRKGELAEARLWLGEAETRRHSPRPG